MEYRDCKKKKITEVNEVQSTIQICNKRKRKGGIQDLFSLDTEKEILKELVAFV